MIDEEKLPLVEVIEVPVALLKLKRPESERLVEVMLVRLAFVPEKLVEK